MAWLGEDELPGGARTGTFLHALLEEVPPASFDGRPELAEWLARDGVAELFRAEMLRHGIEPRYRPSAERIVHATMTADVRLDGRAVVPGLYSCPRVLREMGFLYPYPEDAHPRLSELPRGKLVIERGYVRGFVDQVFQYAGRAYFMDWKSNLLPDYRPETLDREVAAHYQLQAEIYALAVMKLLKVHRPEHYEERFGGLLYCFLRGMRRDGDGLGGVYFRRPTWDEVLGYEESLRRRPAVVGA